MDILKNLPDGLILRRATTQDTDALANLQKHAFAHPDTGELDEGITLWTRNLMSDKHPTFRPNDFLVVEDTKTRALVSCTCLISQKWNMGGISFGVGRIEIVCTDAAYRNRGLVRQQFQILHEWSHERGEMLQAITGIPYYYRQFGYEYAMELAAPRKTFVPQIPQLKKDESEKFIVRHARQADLPFVAEMYQRGQARTLIHCERDLKMFEYEHFVEDDSTDGYGSWWDVIETTEGARVGALCHNRYIFQGRNFVSYYEILPKFAWDEVTPAVLRALYRQTETMQNVDGKPFTHFGWFLAANHPFFVWESDYSTAMWPPYAWYVRVPDLPAFLVHIAPLLEKRLAASDFQNHSGALRFNFYSSGVEIIFENGKIANVQAWRATAGDFGQSGFGNAVFPELTFLKILFGYRSRAELQAMFSDCIMDTDKTSMLIDVLFPKQVSNILPIH